MNKLFLTIPLLALSACNLLPSDAKLADIQAKKVAYICSHQVATRATFELTLKGAEKITNKALHDSVVASVNGDVAILNSCPPVTATTGG